MEILILTFSEKTTKNYLTYIVWLDYLAVVYFNQRIGVLCMPFAGRNQFFDAKTTFWVLLSHKMYKTMQ